MTQPHAVSFEEIDAQVKAIDLTHFQPGGRHYFTAAQVKTSPADVILKVCTVYRAVRPILNALAVFPFLPTSWKNALKAFESLMDSLCPVAQ